MVGYIYKIENIADPSVFYIGSTMRTVDDRFLAHTFAYANRHLSDKGKTAAFQVLSLPGPSRIVELEEVPAGDNRVNLCKRERYHIKQNPQCVNTIRRPFATREEWKEQNGAKSRAYYHANKDRVQEELPCECGAAVRRCQKAKHLRTRRHVDWATVNGVELPDVGLQ